MAVWGLENQQLERLGRELKCPICLSLFKQAVSLSCNHTFCKSCILQSMKSSSSCPICKIPTTRREVRAAPQMDNLVAIFVSMGSSAGLDLPASQAVPVQELTVKDTISKSRKPLSNITNYEQKHQLNPMQYPDYTFKGAIPAKKMVQVPQPSYLQDELIPDDNNLALESDLPNKNMATSEVGHLVMNKRNGQQKKRKESPEKSLADSRDLKTYKRTKRSASLALPSHDTLVDAHACMTRRKREVIDVDASLLNCSKAQRSKGKEVAKFPGDSLAASTEKDAVKSTGWLPATNDTTRRELDTFFWLRDDSSQETDTVQVTQLTLTQSAARPPTFSDLKDSDDECDKDVKEEVTKDAGNCMPGSYDSDEFEWTQQPCSPELRCSPCKAQVSSDIFVDMQLEPPHLVVEVHPINESLEHREDNLPSAESPHRSMSKVAGHSQETTDTADANVAKERQKSDRTRVPSKSKKATSFPAAYAILNGSRPAKNLGGCHCDVTIEDSPSLVGHIPGLHAKKSLAERESFGDPERDKASSKELAEAPRDPDYTQFPCVFCGTLKCSKVTGRMIHYDWNGSPLVGVDIGGKTVHVHKHCAEWAPDVYFVDDVAKNLAVEVARGHKIKCSSCGERGAALGCCIKRCRKSYHYPCARALPCEWEQDRFIMLCPEHKAEKFPVKRSRGEVIGSSKENKACMRQSEEEGTAMKWACGQSSRWILSGSALDKAGKEQLVNFTKITGATICKAWNPNVTHIIAGTDELGAARRTMKFLMAILEGKWILSTKWLAACVDAGQPVDEEPFEVSMDIHGAMGGAKEGRLRAATKATKLFEKLQFYIMPDFLASYKGDLRTLVLAGGGVVLHRKPACLIGDANVDARQCHSIVVYNNESTKSDALKATKIRQQAEARELAIHAGACVVPHDWILDSIASSKVQLLDWKFK